MKQDTNKSNHALTVHISLSGLCVERLVDFSIGVAVRGDLRLRLQLVDTYQPIVTSVACDLVYESRITMMRHEGEQT